MRSVSTSPFLLHFTIPCLPISKNTRNGLANDYRIEREPYGFEVEKIQQNVLILRGECDTMLPLRVSQQVQRRLKHSELRNIPNASHMSILSDEIMVPFFNEILQFAESRTLDSHQSPRSTTPAPTVP